MAPRLEHTRNLAQVLAVHGQLAPLSFSSRIKKV
jgi:hypothetical protein